MNTMRTYFWTALLCCGSALAQDSASNPPLVLTLDECISRVLAHAPLIEAAQYEREVVEGKLQEAKAARILPEIRLRVLGGPVPDVPEGVGPPTFPSVDTDFLELGPFIQARVEAIQPLFTFGKLSNLNKAAQLGVEAKKNQEYVVRNEIVYRVKTIYYGLGYLYSLKDFLEELTDRANKAREQVEEQIRRRSPDVTEIDRMRLDVFTAETDRRLIELNNAIEMGLSSLAILMGLPATTDLNIADKMLRLKRGEFQSIESYLEKAKSTRPEILQLKNGVAIKKALMEIAKADYYPSLFLGGFYAYGKAPGRAHLDNPFFTDSFNTNSGGVALGLEQKLGFHATKARYSQAMAEYKQTMAQEKAALEGIELQIRKAYSNAVSKRDSVKSSENGYRAGRSWVLATTLNYGVGLVPVKDLLESFVAYSKVKAGFFDVLREYYEALSELAKVVGEEIAIVPISN